MKKIFLAFLFCCSIFIAAPVHAAEETHSAQATHEEGAHEESWVQFVGKWVNFAALVGILYYFLGKSLRVQDQFKKEAEEIKESIESARKAKEEAERQMQVMDQRMHQMTDEVAKIKTVALQQAEEEKRKILESAQKEAQRIVDLAHREIDSEVRQAKKNLRKHVSDLAIQKGQKIITEEIDENDQRRMIGTYIDEFGK